MLLPDRTSLNQYGALMDPSRIDCFQPKVARRVLEIEARDSWPRRPIMCCGSGSKVSRMCTPALADPAAVALTTRAMMVHHRSMADRRTGRVGRCHIQQPCRKLCRSPAVAGARSRAGCTNVLVGPGSGQVGGG